LSSTLPAALATGRVTIKADSIAHSVIYDAGRRRASGVRVIDAKTREEREYRASLVVLCASAFESVRLLLNSATEDFPNGLANTSGTLGRYVMDHFPSQLVLGEIDGPTVPNFSGGRPAPLFIPRFRNVADKRSDYVRGFQINAGAYPLGWERGLHAPGVGASLKESLRKRDRWSIFGIAMGEVLPREENRISLDPAVKDAWGVPALHIDMSYGPNEAAMRPDMTACVQEVVEAGGFANLRTIPIHPTPGEAIHEMGGARMGRDPKTSVLNAWNQVHACPNVYVTDGSCMTSAACQNPSLTYMALTARAAEFAVDKLKRGEL
jgi:choline dehydrogenase-like flavoprotein